MVNEERAFDPARRRVVKLAAAVPALWLAGCGGGDGNDDGDGGDGDREVRRLSSFYLETRDGTRIAADL